MNFQLVVDSKNIAGLLTTAKMLREILVAIAKPAEIDNPAYAGFVCRFRKVGCRLAILPLEVAFGTHRVHEIVGGIDPFQSRRQRFRMHYVTLNQLC